MEKIIFTTLACGLIALSARAGVDTNFYSLFNAVPSSKLRPLSSETQDGTTDARTLDAGHFQVESALIDYGYFDFTFTAYTFPVSQPETYHERVDSFVWAPKFSVGLLNNVDFFVRPTYQTMTIKVTSPLLGSSSLHNSDFGTVSTGVKINLWGNDGGTTALAIQPYFRIPTDNGNVMGGADLAFLMRLRYGISVKVAAGVYSLEDGQKLFAAFNNSMSISKRLCPKSELFWYLNSVVTSDSTRPWRGMTGFGLNYNFTGNLQLFAGIGFGLTNYNFDYNPRAGVVWRF